MISGSHFPVDHDEGASSVLHSWSRGPIANSELFEEGKTTASLVFVPSAQRDIYAQESLPDRCLWQVQYYSETLEPSSNVSLLAQTEQEQDDIFYATFPQARGLHWSPQVFPTNNKYGGYFGGTAFALSSNYYRSCGRVECDSSCTSSVCADKSLHIEVGITSPIQPCSASIDSATVNGSCGGHRGAAQTERSSSYSESQVLECDDPHEILASPKIEPFDIPLPESPLQSTVDEESVNELQTSSRCHEPPLMNFLSSSFTGSPRRASPEVEDTLKMDTTSSPAGTWPSVRMRSNQVSEFNSLMDAAESSMCTTNTIPLTAPSPRVPEPNLRPQVQPEPTGLMRLSPLPRNRRPPEKKKTQTLACNFCRVRKIACGPPLAGTVEKTCNQCQRRSRECVFPIESRRGARKKKISMSP